MPSAQDIASKLAYITAQLNAGGTNAQMKEWYFEYEKLNEELKEAKATQATAPDTTAEETLETTAPETTAKEAPKTTAPETTAKSSQTKARKVAFKEPYNHGSPDESARTAVVPPLDLPCTLTSRTSQPSQACNIPLHAEHKHHPDIIAEPMISSGERPENDICE